MQTEVMEILMKNLENHNFDSYQNSIIKHLNNQNYKDPEVAILLFSSVIKGFVMQYAFAPEMFSNDLVTRFKEKYKQLFFGNKSDSKLKGDIQLNDELSYFLL
jgi:hypothetical protein